MKRIRLNKQSQKSRTFVSFHNNQLFQMKNYFIINAINLQEQFHQFILFQRYQLFYLISLLTYKKKNLNWQMNFFIIYGELQELNFIKLLMLSIILMTLLNCLIFTIWSMTSQLRPVRKQRRNWKFTQNLKLMYNMELIV